MSTVQRLANGAPQHTRRGYREPAASGGRSFPPHSQRTRRGVAALELLAASGFLAA